MICIGCRTVAAAGLDPDCVVREVLDEPDPESGAYTVDHEHCEGLCPCQHKPLGSWKGDK